MVSSGTVQASLLSAGLGGRRSVANYNFSGTESDSGEHSSGSSSHSFLRDQFLDDFQVLSHGGAGRVR